MTMKPLPLKHPSLLIADDWGLYACDMDCTRAVASLNAALMNACMATNPNAFRHVMRTAMTRWSEYGSFDGDAVRLVDRYCDGLSARFELAAMKPPVSLSADDWQLYTASMDCTLAVAELNLALARGIKARSEDDFRAGMDAVCRKFAGYGASDPEALRLVERYRKAAFTPLPFAAGASWSDQAKVKPLAGVEGGLPGAGAGGEFIFIDGMPDADMAYPVQDRTPGFNFIFAGSDIRTLAKTSGDEITAVANQDSPTEQSARRKPRM